MATGKNVYDIILKARAEGLESFEEVSRYAEKAGVSLDTVSKKSKGLDTVAKSIEGITKAARVMTIGIAATPATGGIIGAALLGTAGVSGLVGGLGILVGALKAVQMSAKGIKIGGVKFGGTEQAKDAMKSMTGFKNQALLSVVDMGTSLAPAIQKSMGGLGGFFAPIMKQFTSSLPAINKLLPPFVASLGKMGQVIGVDLMRGMPVMLKLANAVMPGWITATKDVGNGLQDMWQKMLGFVNYTQAHSGALHQIWSNLKGDIDDVERHFKPFGDAVETFFKTTMSQRGASNIFSSLAFALNSIPVSPLKLVMDFLTFLVNHPTLLKIAMTFAVWGGAVAKLLGLLGKLPGAINAVKGAAEALSGVMEVMLDNPITLIPVLIGALVLLYLKNKWFHDKVNALWKDLTSFIKKHWGAMIIVLTGGLAAPIVLLIKNFGKVKSAMRSIGSAAKSVGKTVYNAFWTAIHAVANLITKTIPKAFRSVAKSTGHALSGLGHDITHPWDIFHASGGLIGRGSDTQPAMLTPGEFVMRREAVNRLGVSTLRAMNAGGTPMGAGGGGDLVVHTTIELDGQKLGKAVDRYNNRRKGRQN